MSLITTYEHFNVDPISLPNSVPGTNNSEGDKLQQFISQLEPEFLKIILGYPLYDDFVNNIGDGGKYDKLKNGDTFSDTFGITQKWEGFANAGKNPIACYVYWFWQKSNTSNTFGIGETAADVENGKRVSPYNKMMIAWNKMVDFNLTLHEYLCAKETDFPDYIGLQYPPFGFIPIGYPENLRQQQELFIKITSF